MVSPGWRPVVYIVPFESVLQFMSIMFQSYRLDVCSASFKYSRSGTSLASDGHSLAFHRVDFSDNCLLRAFVVVTLPCG